MARMNGEMDSVNLLSEDAIVAFSVLEDSTSDFFVSEDSIFYTAITCESTFHSLFYFQISSLIFATLYTLALPSPSASITPSSIISRSMTRTLGMLNPIYSAISLVLFSPSSRR